jgi:hypothetical protein
VCFDESLRAKIDQIKSDLHHAPGTRLLLERAVLLVVIGRRARVGPRASPPARCCHPPDKWKDYRAKAAARYKLITLDADAFIRRFLIHVLPAGFHRIRRYGLFANGNRAANLALARRLLSPPDPAASSSESGVDRGHEDEERNTCPCCSGRMIIVETFEPGCQPQFWPIPPVGLDSS